MPLGARLDGQTVELLSAYQVSLRARARYGEQQLQVDEGRLRRGVTGAPVLDLSGPSFAERLRGLLPPEQTLSARDRMLATRAAEGLARYGVASADGTGADLLAAGYADLPAYYPPASRMLGLAQRTFGAPLDGTLTEALGFLDRDPIGARPLRAARQFLVRRAAVSYGLAGRSAA